jgi:hypothetical protein
MYRVKQRIRESLVDLRDKWMLADLPLPLENRWRVKANRGTDRYSPFFIIGHPRSGTTLLRAILSRHRSTFVPPENGGLPRMIRVFGGLRRSPWEVVVDKVLAEFKRGYEFEAWGLDPEDIRQRAIGLAEESRTLDELIAVFYLQYGAIYAPGKTMWGDKTTPGSFRYYLGKLSLVFPGARYLHIVRDGRDCVASAIKVGFFNRNVESAAQAWRYNVRRCRRLGQGLGAGGKYLEIRYEQLVNDVAGQLRAICAFLNLEPDTQMLEHHDNVAQRLPDVKTLSQHANVTRPVFQDSVGNWQLAFSREQVRVLNRIMRSELAHYGYDV